MNLRKRFKKQKEKIFLLCNPGILDGLSRMERILFKHRNKKLISKQYKIYLKMERLKKEQETLKAEFKQEVDLIIKRREYKNSEIRYSFKKAA